jgi:hypothetical protein
MNRRNMLQRSAFAIAAFLAGGILSGCPSLPGFGGILSTISAYVPIGLAAFNGVLLLLTSAGIIPPGTSSAIGAVVLLVKAGFADLLAAVQEYQNAPAAQKATLKGRITEILTVLGDNIQKFASDIISTAANNPLLVTVTGLLALILSTLAGFAGQLPAPVSGRKTLTLAGKPVTPKTLSLKEFKKQWNQLAGSGGHPEIELR